MAFQNQVYVSENDSDGARQYPNGTLSNPRQAFGELQKLLRGRFASSMFEMMALWNFVDEQEIVDLRGEHQGKFLRGHIFNFAVDV